LAEREKRWGGKNKRGEGTAPGGGRKDRGNSAHNMNRKEEELKEKKESRGPDAQPSSGLKTGGEKTRPEKKKWNKKLNEK